MAATERITMTMRELDRFKVIQDVADGPQAALVLKHGPHGNAPDRSLIGSAVPPPAFPTTFAHTRQSADRPRSA
ncbi:hypothetical protein DIE13_02420 [Burkholderia sp. Bp9016]|nr:hypothetical protein DIE13_02420 [Burkholderia sp. Bp9016]